MNVDPQRQQALADKILSVVAGSKKYAKVLHATSDLHVSVEVELRNPTEADYNTIREAIKFSYAKWGGAEGRVEHLYATLAHIWPDNGIIITECDNVGSGTTTHFNPNSPSQAKFR